MQKIILELLTLLWKAFRVVLWKWLKPILAQVVIVATLAIGLIAIVIFLVTR